MEEARGGLWKNCGSTERDRRNERSILVWSLSWMVVWTSSIHGIKSGWLPGGTAGVVVAALTSLALGGATVMAYRRYLSEADELLRKIQLDALALAVGVGLVGGFTHGLLVQADLLETESFSVVAMLISAAYVVGVITGRRRYA